MKVRADDDIWRVRLVFLGPPGYNFPIHLPYSQWALWFVLAFVFSAILVPLTGTWASTGLATGLSMIVTHIIWRQVDPDRPALKVLLTAAIDTKQIKAVKENTARLSANHIRISEHITGDPR